MTYAEWVQAAVTILQISTGNGTTAFTALAPRFIEFAENRMYRDPDLDFLFMREVDVSQSTVNGQRSVPIPASLVTIESAALITPTGTLPTTAGSTRIPMIRATRPFIDLTWPVESQTQAPTSFTPPYFAVFDMQQTSPAVGEDEAAPLPSSILIAPTPDDIYKVEFTGTFRPAPLSASNTTTPLTNYLPDLFLAATLVIACGYQRDFGAQSDNPSIAVSWENLYQALRAGAGVLELRKKALVDGFSALPPVRLTIPIAPGPAPQRAQ